MSVKTDKRAKEILHLLLQDGRASVDELIAKLGTSPASVRRDLTKLERQGLVHRTHGGAMLAGNGAPSVYEPFRFDADFREREDRFAAEKLRIAKAAAALVQEGETVGIATGTTTTLVARQLIHRKNLHIITNAVNIGMELSSSARVQTTLTGGSLRWPGAFSLVGPAAIESLATVVMDRLFVGATGVDPGRGAMVIQAEEAAVFRAMVRQARQCIVVADSSKLGHASPAVVCTAKEIGCLITDNGVPEELKRQFETAGVKVTVV
jgi:DeoR family transcriptional regulator, aga operon transcriptional repressor